MAALRKKLRAIFDELDADKSGYISTDEMQAICKKLKLDIKPAALKQLIKEADPDGSGQIDFDEFVGALKKQMAKRKAGGASSGTVDLASITVESGGFGWLNPLSWFGGSDAGDDGGAKTATGRKGGGPRPHGELGPTTRYYAQWGTESRCSDDFSPTHWVKQTVAEHQEENWKSAQQIREQAAVAGQIKAERTALFHDRLRRRIHETQRQRNESASAVEALKEEKRMMGSQMKQSFEDAWEQEGERRVAHAARGRRRVIAAKEAKEAKTLSRYAQKRRASIAASMKGRNERMARKERAKSTVLKEAAEAKAYTARVRYETRPDVRKEGRDMFQAQRDALVAAEKQQQVYDAWKIDRQRARYLKQQKEVKDKVGALHVSAKHARDSLADARKQEAAEMKSLLQREKERKETLKSEWDATKKGMRDEIYGWSRASMIGPDRSSVVA